MLAGLLAAIVLALPACSSEQNNGGGASLPAVSGTGGSLAQASPSPAAQSAASTIPTTPPLGLSAVTPASVPTESPLLSTAGLTASSPADLPGPATQAAGFVGNISTIDDATAARMATSWRPGCPVALTDLRYLTLTYRGFDDADHQGELVVGESVASDVVDIFRSLYAAGYPIASLRLVDDFGGSDDDSMAANNSSAFNCRPVTGGGGFSEHSYGTAIDLNPVQNPYLSGSLVLPEGGRPYADRQSAPGVIEPGDPVVAAFAAHGWTWGGEWSGPIDYQHFSISGR